MSPETHLQDPLRFHRKTPPCAVVIYGANGDLTKRKLMPALYRLAYEGRLAPGFAVIGVSRTAMSNDEFRERMHDSVKKFLEDSPFDEDLWKSFAQGLFYLAGRRRRSESYQALGKCLAEVGRSPARPKATSSSISRRSPASTPRSPKGWPRPD
jgi:glucose-6-phosphate 1-dehydrogenase